MTRISAVHRQLASDPALWLVTGAAGFIGSNLVEHLLGVGQTVIGLDNFVTGHQRNLDDVRARVGDAAWERFRFLEGDLIDARICREACARVDYVLHQAALGSVPRSIADPVATNRANIDGFLNILVAARDSGVRRLVYASSSSVYGDHPDLPKVEPNIGQPLSPYALTKRVAELYAGIFDRAYGMKSVGLRYFNVFGRRQDPNGAYAAVIPRWIENLLSGRRPMIHGDGETSRDFCYVDNVVQANVLAATASNDELSPIYNIAVGGRTTLNHLFDAIRTRVASHRAAAADVQPEYGPFRPGDVRHSQADITRAIRELGYTPEWSVEAGLSATVDWYIDEAAVPA